MLFFGPRLLLGLSVGGECAGVWICSLTPWLHNIDGLGQPDRVEPSPTVLRPGEAFDDLTLVVDRTSRAALTLAKNVPG